MNLIARTPSFVTSSTSVSPGNKYYGNQDPWKSVAGEDKSGQPGKETDLFEASDHFYHEQFMESFSSTDYSKMDYDCAWSSQEWKAEATMHDRSGQPDNSNSQEVANSENFVMGSDAAEFANKVKDQVRKRQKRISNVAGEGEEHSIIWGTVYGCNDGLSNIHGEEFPRQSEFHCEYYRSHTEANVRHICQISERTR